MKMLTAIACAKITKPGRYAVGNGAYLQITGDRGRSWVFRYEQNGLGHHIGLGPVSLVTLAQAREKALAFRKLLLDGVDPISHKREARVTAAKEPVTFRECAERYIAAHEGSWRNVVHRKQWRTSLETLVHPILGDLPVAAIDTGLVLKVLEPVWRDKPETASRVRGRIESVLDWARARQYRSGENPARWRGHLDHLLADRRKIARVKHHAAMPYNEIPSFMSALRPQDGNAAAALEFTILNAARIGEVLGARWDEIDGEVWTVPAARMKADRVHRVPLSPRAVELLDGVKRDGALVFPAARGGMMRAAEPRRVLGRLGHDGVTVHGFRSSFRDWAAERTNHPREVCEAALAHVVGSATESAYARSDLLERRRRLMAEWSKYCSTAPSMGVNILPLRAGS
jgi:integrase